MIANADKVQAIIMKKRRENQITHKLKIYKNEIETTKSVKFMGNKEKIAMINSFVYANFNYCPLVWQFYSCDFSIKNRKKIQKRCLRLVLDDYESDY